MFENVRGFVYLFFGLQVYPLILFSLEAVLPVPGLIEAVLGIIAIFLVFVSAIVALVGAAITLRNAPVLEWWMIALGVLPWMVIATEVTLPFVFTWL